MTEEAGGNSGNTISRNQTAQKAFKKFTESQHLQTIDLTEKVILSGDTPSRGSYGGPEDPVVRERFNRVSVGKAVEGAFSGDSHKNGLHEAAVASKRGRSWVGSRHKVLDWPPPITWLIPLKLKECFVCANESQRDLMWYFMMACWPFEKSQKLFCVSEYARLLIYMARDPAMLEGAASLNLAKESIPWLLQSSHALIMFLFRGSAEEGFNSLFVISSSTFSMQLIGLCSCCVIQKRREEFHQV